MSTNLDLIRSVKKDSDNIQKNIASFETTLNVKTIELSVIQYLTASRSLHKILAKQNKPLIKKLHEKEYRRILKVNNIQNKDSIEFNLRMIYAGYPYLALERLNKIVSNQNEDKNTRLKALYHIGKFHINGTLGSLGESAGDDLGLAIPALIKVYKSGNPDAGYWIGRIEEQLINYPSAIKIYQELGNKNNLLSKNRLQYIQSEKELNDNVRNFIKKR